MTIINIKTKSFKTARIKQGMSIRALAKAAQLSTATVFKVENQNSVPSPATAKKLCDALGVDFELIFEVSAGKGA